MAIRSLFTTLRRCRNNPPSLLLLEEQSSRSFSSGTSSIVMDTLEESPQPQDKDLKSRIFKLRFPKRSATTVIQNWVSEGNKVTLSELRQLAKDLRRSQRYKHALEISEWIVTHQEFELSDTDYAVRIDLMTKVFGVDAAERYFQGLPVTAKTSETYTALLHSYASAKMTERAEGLFERIKESNVSMNALFYNEMMTLYMSVGELGKVSLVIEELKRQKVSPDLFTYNLWISSCAATMDIDSVRRILDEMSEDCNSNEGWVTYRKLADIYITTANLVNSEDNVPVETEKKITQREWITYDFLIILYTGLGNKERIDAIWKSLKMTSHEMTSRNFICIISSYMMLGQLKEVGEVLDEWTYLESEEIAQLWGEGDMVFSSATTDFDAHECERLLDAFAGVGLMETAESLRTLIIQKKCNLIDGSQ